MDKDLVAIELRLSQIEVAICVLVARSEAKQQLIDALAGLRARAIERMPQGLPEGTFALLDLLTPSAPARADG